MTWESSRRAKRLPGAFFEAVFDRFGLIDGFGTIVDAVTTALPYRARRSSSRASPATCAASSSSSGIPPFFLGLIYGTRKPASRLGRQIIPKTVVFGMESDQRLIPNASRNAPTRSRSPGKSSRVRRRMRSFGPVSTCIRHSCRTF